MRIRHFIEITVASESFVYGTDRVARVTHNVPGDYKIRKDEATYFLYDHLKSIKLVLAFITSTCLLFGCEQVPKSNKVKFDGFTFRTDAPISNKKTDALMEGSELKFNMGNMRVIISSSYYSNNLYEYDWEIASPDDTVRLHSLKENNIPYVVATRKSDVDLDYYRIYNVFFDTINNLPIKVMKPRIPYSHPYKIFVAEIPQSHKKNIGYKSLTITFEHVKNESDVATFESFYKSMNHSPEK